MRLHFSIDTMLLFVCDWLIILSIASVLVCAAAGSLEVSRARSSTFLNTRVSPRRKYEESVERIETNREVSNVSCIVQHHRPLASFAWTNSGRRTHRWRRSAYFHVLNRCPLSARSTAVKLSIVSKAMVGVRRRREDVRMENASRTNGLP